MGHDISCQGINLAAVLQGIFMMKGRKKREGKERYLEVNDLIDKG